MQTRSQLADAARKLLAQPAAGGAVPARWRELGWPAYLRKRGWLNEQYDDASDDAKAASVKLLSSALSFPLTLARAWPQLVSSEDFRSGPSICVVGARAEASLPIHVWQELLLLTCESSVRLEFMGPAAAPEGVPAERVASVRMQTAGRSMLTLSLSHAGLFHESELGRALLQREGAAPREPDAFVLYNPGLGEPGWERAWAPTLRALGASRRPLLMSALSEEDAARDVSHPPCNHPASPPYRQPSLPPALPHSLAYEA